MKELLESELLVNSQLCPSGSNFLFHFDVDFCASCGDYSCSWIDSLDQGRQWVKDWIETNSRESKDALKFIGAFEYQIKLQLKDHKDFKRS